MITIIANATIYKLKGKLYTYYNEIQEIRSQFLKFKKNSSALKTYIRIERNKTYLLANFSNIIGFFFVQIIISFPLYYFIIPKNFKKHINILIKKKTFNFLKTKWFWIREKSF